MRYYDCPPTPPWFWTHSRCGVDRDCIPDDRQPGGTFREIVCSAMVWNSKHETRWTEVWDPTNSYMILRVDGRFRAVTDEGICAGVAQLPPAPGQYAETDAFTIDIPGIQDIIKVKQWESPQLRYERYQRYKTRNSAIPDWLEWLPPLLTKLDDAQDMLFTGIALLIPLAKYFPRAMMPGLGVLLHANDIIDWIT